MGSPSSMEISYVRCVKCGEIMKCSRYDTAVLLDHIRKVHPDVDIIDTNTKRKRHFNDSPIRTISKRDDETQEDCDLENCSFNNKEHNSNNENAASQTRGTLKSRQPQYVKDIDLPRYSATSEILEKYPEIKECEYAPHNPDAQVAYTRRYKLSTPSPVSLGLLEQPFQHTLYRTSIEKWCPANGTIYCPKCGSNKRPLIKTKAERFTYNECGAFCLLSCWPFCFIPWILPGQNLEYLYCASCKTFLGLYDRSLNCLKPNRLFSTTGKFNSNRRENENLSIKRDPAKQNKMLEDESAPSLSSATASTKPGDLSSIIVNGNELPPEAVARINKYKRYSSLVGIDLKAVKSSPNLTNRQNVNKEVQAATTSVAKEKFRKQSF